MHPTCRPRDVEPFESAMPDMVEVVRFTDEAGRRPALVVSRRKMSRSLLAQLRRFADESGGDA